MAKRNVATQATTPFVPEMPRIMNGPVKVSAKVAGILERWEAVESESINRRGSCAKELFDSGEIHPGCFVAPSSGGALSQEDWDKHLVMRALRVKGGARAVELQGTPAKNLSEADKKLKTKNRQAVPRIIEELKKCFMRYWEAEYGATEPAKESKPKQPTKGAEGAEGAEGVKRVKAVNFADKGQAHMFFSALEDALEAVRKTKVDVGYPIERVIQATIEIQQLIVHGKITSK